MRRPIPCNNLGRWERAATPYEFAQYLIDLVHPVAVLWVCENTVYDMFPGLDLWGVRRDARTYDGPGPIIAHPPCGPWGRFRFDCGQSPEDGRIAMELVHRLGGVVEQPVGNKLFATHGRPGAEILRVNQFDYGHRALKPTDLYVWTVENGAA